MTLKQDYFQHRNSSIKDDNRNSMAEREVDTIIYLLKVFYGFDLGKGGSVLDLGSGDQFLKGEFIKREILYTGLDINDLDFYFVHSFQFKVKKKNHLIATADYGVMITAIVGRDNMIGTQFHPEKSQGMGLRLIQNFLTWRP